MSISWFRTQVLLPYGFAVLCTVVATWLRCSMTPYLDDRVPFGCFFVSVLVSAWVGGTGPAVASLVLGIWSAAHFIIPPEGSLLGHRSSDLFSLAVYFLVGVASIGLFSQLACRTREAERQSAENLRLSAELTQHDRRKDEFLAVLAHELRNPLAPVRSGVSLLCRMCGSDARAEELSTMLNRQISHLSCIVDDLMDVSRYIRDELTLCREELNLEDVVNDAVDSVTNEMTNKKHRFTTTITDQLLFVDGDRVRLIQILTNLLLNAAKYTPDAGRIQLFVSGTDDVVQLEVRDNGIGIDPACQSEIFDLFTQMSPVSTREHGGLGLGLAIVRTLTEKHGGTVAVFSEGRGRGTRFVVELPRVQSRRPAATTQTVDISEAMSATGTFKASATLASTTPASVAPATVTPAERRTSVYIVDDNRDAAEAMSMLLQLDGFDVACFDDGPTAIQAVAVSPPDTILLDIGMPGMDGYEVARRIRSLKCGSEIQIVACTGWGRPADIQRSRDAGIDHHLVKPVDPPRIVDLLTESVSAVA